MSQTKPHKQHAGFGVIVVIVCLVIVAVIGLIGWKVIGSRQTQTSTSATSRNQATDNTYTDTAKRFTLHYPTTWTAGFQQLGNDSGNPVPDWTKTSRPALIKPKSGYPSNTIALTPGCSAADITAAKANIDRFHTQQDLKVNGYSAFYDRLDFASDAESYLTHTYYVLGTKDCLRISWDQNRHHDMSSTNFDDSQNYDGFMTVVNSVKFTN
jgi:hypothetical protein